MKNAVVSMTPRVKTAYALNIFIIILGFTFGLRYILASGLLGYQLDAMGLASWTEVVPEYRRMLITFLRVAGVGMSTASVGMTVVLFCAFRRGENWSRWGVAGIFFAHYVPLMVNMAYLKTMTAANPPYLPNIIAMVVVVTSFFLSSGLSECKMELPLRTDI